MSVVALLVVLAGCAPDPSSGSVARSVPVDASSDLGTPDLPDGYYLVADVGYTRDQVGAVDRRDPGTAQDSADTTDPDRAAELDAAERANGAELVRRARASAFPQATLARMPGPGPLCVSIPLFCESSRGDAGWVVVLTGPVPGIPEFLAEPMAEDDEQVQAERRARYFAFVDGALDDALAAAPGWRELPLVTADGDTQGGGVPTEPIWVVSVQPAWFSTAPEG